jgi:NAD(P)-dependent dehydrogenase (short-subunit alcohol dehydrogenase family)
MANTGLEAAKRARSVAPRSSPIPAAVHTDDSNADEVVMNVEGWVRQQVLVVGASRGVGAALVAALLARGAVRVWAASRSGVCIDDPRVTPLMLDATDEVSLAAAVTQIRGGTDRLDAVIHTPGLLQNDQLRPERRMQDLTLDALQASFAVNAFAPILTAKHLMPLLWHGERAIFASLSARVGSIGDNGLGGWYSYRAAKAAQNQLIHTAAIEAARRSKALICCTLHPGTVDTGLSKPFQAGVKPEKLFTPERAARQLLDVLAGLTPADSGGFFAWDGQRIPW